MSGRPELPAELEAWVRTAVEAARLPLRDREEVARELRAHFEDGLDAGRTVDELLERFGDPLEAAHGIRAARVDGPSARSRRWKGRMTMTGGETFREIRRAARTLWRAPGFAAVVILTLALGVGANTAVFTVLDGVLLEPLPYPEPDRLVRVYDVYDEQPDELNDYLRAPSVVAMEEWSDVFAGMTTLYTYREIGADLTGSTVPERVVVSRVSWNYFPTLRVSPMIGRSFEREESHLGGEYDGHYHGAPVAILSHALWQRTFAGDREALGRTLELDGVAYEVIGVMPPDFENPMGSRPDLWIPADLTFGGSNNWGNHYLTGLARLQPELSIAAAQERVNALNARLNEEHPDNEGWSIAIRPLHGDLVGERRAKLLWILAGAVGLILVSACVNVANVVFARSLGRDRDVALRGALGSSRSRLMGHLLMESALLAVIGGALGLALGTVGIRGLLALAPDALPVVATPTLSLRVFGFALAAVVVALLLFGLAPAVRMSRTTPATVLRSGGRSGTEGRGLKRMRGLLVVTQVAVAVVLVAGSGLLLQSFRALQAVDLGIDDTGVLTAEVHLPSARYAEGADRHRFHQEFQASVAGLAEVESVGATSWLPANGRYHWWSVGWAWAGWDGDADVENPGWIGSDIRVVAGDYFASMGIELQRGEAWREPAPDGERVVWVNEAFTTESALGGADPLGELIFVGGEARRVVGVVENAPHDPQGTLSPKTYVPHAQFAGDRNWSLIQTVKLRPGADPAQAREAIRTALAGIDSQLVLYRVRPLSSLLAGARAQERFAALLMTVFAVLALLIALVGAYGVLAGSVARRRREIGIRMALGAEPGRVRSMVLGSAARLSVGGVGIGVAVAWYGSRWMDALLFEVQREDPWVYLGAAGLILALGAVAGWLPARRATRVDPAVSLSGE